MESLTQDQINQIVSDGIHCNGCPDKGCPFYDINVEEAEGKEEWEFKCSLFNETIQMDNPVLSKGLQEFVDRYNMHPGKPLRCPQCLETKKKILVKHIGDLYDGDLLRNAEPGTIFQLELDAVVVDMTKV